MGISKSVARVGDRRRSRRSAAIGIAFVVGLTGLTALPRTAAAIPGEISTYAGSGSSGFSGDGGPAIASQLNSPNDVALDAAGNVYIADRNNQRVRKVTAAGTITTVAGNGTAGFSGDGGPATSASLNGPEGLALDGSGALYIADVINHRVRKVDASGTITTVAGTGTSGYGGDGGPATSARLTWPRDVAVGASGELYIADGTNYRVRKVDATGTITTVAGNGTSGYSGDGGPATSASFALPISAVPDAAGNLFISDASNHRVRKVDASGTITTVAGTGTSGYGGDGGPATSAMLNVPSRLGLDSAGNVYIPDYGNQRVRQLDVGTGVIRTVAGSGASGYGGDGGAATSAQMFLPYGVSVDAAGNFYVAEVGNHVVRKIEAGTYPLTATTTTSTTTPTSTTSTTTLPPVTTTTTSVPSLGFSGYPSDDCVGGTTMVNGWVDDAYSSVQASMSTSVTSICFVHEQGGLHVGGKVTVATAAPATPTTDAAQPACADPAVPGDYQLVRDVSVLGRQVKVDTKLRPSASTPSEAWVCIKADTLAVRLIVPTSVSGLPSFSLDSSSPHVPPYVPNAPVSGKASSLCQQSGGEGGRVVNLTVANTPVWLYRWQESGTRAHVCVRFGPALNDGGRLTVDTNGGVTLVGTDAGNDRGPCPQQIVDDAGPPAWSLYTSAPGAVPAWVCVRVGTMYRRVTLDSAGGQGIATFVRDS